MPMPYDMLVNELVIHLMIMLWIPSSGCVSLAALVRSQVRGVEGREASGFWCKIHSLIGG